jgi:hypothetical protein
MFSKVYKPEPGLGEEKTLATPTYMFPHKRESICPIVGNQCSHCPSQIREIVPNSFPAKDLARPQNLGIQPQTLSVEEICLGFGGTGKLFASLIPSPSAVRRNREQRFRRQPFESPSRSGLLICGVFSLRIC